MRNTEGENLMEHSFMTAVIAHALAEISNQYFGNNLDSNKIATMALFHDVGEIFTGDMPTPVKYIDSQLTDNYKRVERLAIQKLTEQLPDKLKLTYKDVLEEKGTEGVFVKYADKLSAYLKCVKEISFGNTEFKNAKESILAQLEGYESKEVDFFLQNFTDAFLLTLDELQL